MGTLPRNPALEASYGRRRVRGTPALAKAAWKAVLTDELGLSRRGHAYDDFDLPLRRKFPLAQPAILKRQAIVNFNRGKPYTGQIKPFNFLQVLTSSVLIGEDVLPVAPHEKDAAAARKLPWMDLRTGRASLSIGTGRHTLKQFRSFV